MKCPKCGYYMDDQLMICPQCGASVGGAGGDGQAEETFGASDGGSPKKQHKGLIIGIILLIAAIAAGLGIYYYRITYICREIHLNKQSIELLVGDSDALNAEFVPETTKDKALTWESSDENVASVDESGIVTGIGSGECTITATSSNGKTDACTVLVKSLIDIQKESVASVVDYIKKNNPTDENGVAVAKIADIDDEHSFALGSIGDDLVLVYRDEVEVESVDIGVKYTTYVNVESGNLETSEVVQDNQVTISGYPVATTLRGAISLAEYQGGDKVTVDSVVSTLEGLEVNESLQKQLDSGTKGCYQQFKAFLESHPALGCTMENFGFTAPERVEEETEDTVSSSATVVEEIEEPGTDSSVSAAESAMESVVESVIEDPAVPESGAELPMVVGGVDAAADTAESQVEEAAGAVESQIEDAVGIAGAVDSQIEDVAGAVESQVEEAADAAAGTVESRLEEARSAVSEAMSALESVASSLEAAGDGPETESAGDGEAIAIDEAISGLESAEEQLQEAESAIEETENPAVGAGMAGAAVVEEPEELPGADSSAESLSESMLESLVEAVIEEIEEIGQNAAKGTEAEPDSPNSSRADSEAAFKSITDSLGGPNSRPPFGAVIVL